MRLSFKLCKDLLIVGRTSVLAGVILVFSFALHAAEIEISITPDSVDQEVVVTFENPTSLPIEDIKIELQSTPGWAKNVQLSRNAINSLIAKGSTTVTLKFDVVKEIAIGTLGNIILGFSTDDELSELSTKLLIIIPDLGEQISTLTEGEQQAEEGPNEATITSKEHVLHLIEIEHPTTASATTHKWEFAENSPGFVLTESARTSSGEIVQSAKISMGFSKLPNRIMLGQPFSITTAGRKQIERLSGNCFNGGKTKAKLNMWVDVTHEHAFSGKANSDVLDLDCKAPVMGFTTGAQHGGFSLGVDLNVTINCKFLNKTSNSNNDSFKYEYQCIAKSAVDNHSAPRTITLRWPKNRMRLFTLGLGEFWGLHVYYGDDTNVNSLTDSGYEHPFEMATLLHDSGGEEESRPTPIADSGHEGGDTTSTGQEDNSDIGRAASEVEGTQIASQSSDQETVPTQTGNTDSSGVPVSPDDPNIAALINQWIHTAEPPQNATEGGNFRYNEWAQLQGTSANGGRATPRSRPDAASGQTSIDYLWSVRDKKDSVDHCTLGEYIEKKLAGESIAGCAGRYKPIVPRLVGQPVKAAMTKLNQLKLTTRIKVGSPAPTKALEGRVERQGVPSQAKVARGSTVELWVHTAFIGDFVILDDWIGKLLAEAKAALDRTDVGVSIKLGSPAGSSAAAGTVESQNPKGGMRVKKGTKVVLVVHSKFIDQVTLGDFRGITVANAKLILEKQQLRVVVRVGSPARRASASGTVETQSPKPGLRMARGSEVTLTVHSRFSNTVRVPGVVGQSFQQASATLQRAGFQVQRSGGGSGSNSTVASQTPAFNMSALYGSTVQLVLQAASTVPGLPANGNPASSPTGPPRGTLDCEVNLQHLGITTINNPTYAKHRMSKIHTPATSTDPYYYVGCHYEYNGENYLVQIFWFEKTPQSRSITFSRSACRPGLKRADLSNSLVGGVMMDLSFADTGGARNGKAAYAHTSDTRRGNKRYLDLLGESRFEAIAEGLLAKVRPFAVSCPNAPRLGTNTGWVNPLDAAGIRLPVGVRLLDPKPQRSTTRCSTSPIDRNPITILTNDFAKCKAPWIIDGNGQYQGTWGRYCAWCPAGTNWTSGTGCCQGVATAPTSRSPTRASSGNSGINTNTPVGSGSLCCPSGWSHTTGLLGDLGACQRWQNGRVVESRDMGHRVANGTCRF